MGPAVIFGDYIYILFYKIKMLTCKVVFNVSMGIMNIRHVPAVRDAAPVKERNVKKNNQHNLSEIKVDFIRAF